jgi:hypothetical protein
MSRVSCFIRNNGSLYFEHPIVLSIIIILFKESTNRREAILILIQAIRVQEQSVVIKAPDLYYKGKSKLDFFLISIDIYILFNQYLFGTEATKIVYAISYFRGIAFN